MALNLRFDASDEAFRDEVRAFLDEALTDDLREAARRQTTVFADRDVAMRWQRILHERKGWAAPTWPKAFGGPGWTATQRYIFNEECARAGAPGLIPLGTRMLAPVLFRYGTPAQQEYYLPRMLSGEHYWCQGYSEPGSGSDLSSLSTRAVPDGEDYIVNGTKIWTTHAQFADHIFCLVRTDPDARPQAGITFLLIPMATPGITVKPILTLAGDHEVNQVFFDDVRVPRDNRVGPEHAGWTVAKYLLEFERGGGGAAARLKVALEELRALLDRVALGDDHDLRRRVVELEIGIRGLEVAELQALCRLADGDSPGPGSSLQKNTSVDLEQALNVLRLEVIGYLGLPHYGLIARRDNNAPELGDSACEVAAGRYLNSRAASIFGGSKEVQKNIIARAVLGL
ncbi:MAG: acyl-CoA dehydrogenase family protein [Pseudomonadales bacterium]|jgi:acyl-CoA dehydrogenase|nr:acyl-CoA dehydrogenase family protein [Pseudomonadales bacterium]